jgi:hypothetical protein
VSGKELPSSVGVDDVDASTTRWEEPHPGSRLSYPPDAHNCDSGDQRQNDAAQQSSTAIESKETTKWYPITAIKQPIRLRRRNSRSRLYKSPLSATQSIMDFPSGPCAEGECLTTTTPLPTETIRGQSHPNVQDALESDKDDRSTPNSSMCPSPVLSDVSNFLSSVSDSDSDMTMVEPEASVALPTQKDPYGWDAELLHKVRLHHAPCTHTG